MINLKGCVKTKNPSTSTLVYTPILEKPRQKVTSKKISITCPNCLIKLGVNINSDSDSNIGSHVEKKEKTVRSIYPYPDDGGDKAREEQIEKTGKHSASENAVENRSIPYSLLKGCTSMFGNTCPIAFEGSTSNVEFENLFYQPQVNAL